MDKSFNRRQLGSMALGAMALPVLGALARPGRAEPAKPQATASSPAIPVAFLIDEQVTAIDFIGPWEAFQDAGYNQAFGFELYMVSPDGGIVNTTGGGEFKAKYSLADAPQPRVVVIPAQRGGLSPGDPRKIEWLRHVFPNVDVVLSVCTGNFLMARTGLLDGLSATTHHGFYDQFEKMFPQVRLMRDRRFVDDGKIVSAGGLTSSIDGALHVVDRYFGPQEAKRVAAWMEHDGDSWRTGVRT